MAELSRIQKELNECLRDQKSGVTATCVLGFLFCFSGGGGGGGGGVDEWCPIVGVVGVVFCVYD